MDDGVVTTYTLALLGHILGVLLFVSGIAVAGTAFEVARQPHRTPSDVAAILGVARAGIPLVGAGAVALLGFGLWLVRLGDWSYSTGWITAALALFVVAMALGAIGGRVPRQARLRASRLADNPGEADEELRTLLDDRRSRACNAGSTVLLLAIVALMVLKP